MAPRMALLSIGSMSPWTGLKSFILSSFPFPTVFCLTNQSSNERLSSATAARTRSHGYCSQRQVCFPLILTFLRHWLKLYLQMMEMINSGFEF
jgi:hypothetical protein